MIIGSIAKWAKTIKIAVFDCPAADKTPLLIPLAKANKLTIIINLPTIAEVKGAAIGYD